MMPPLTTMGDARPSQPVELSGPQIQQLRDTSGWARFLAIALFIVAGALGLAFVGIFVKTRGASPVENISVPNLIPAVISLGVTGAAAALLWLYGRAVLAFFRQGEPSLAQAFRKLRIFFKLWTIFVVLGIVTDVVELLGKL
jgi:hypothetical protein